jgi:hypothetical protein
VLTRNGKKATTAASSKREPATASVS